MKNKRIKKYIVSFLILLITNISLIFIINKYEYKTYTNNYNNKINIIINNIKEKYPNIKESDIIEILNTETNNIDILDKYGINDNNGIIENDKFNNKITIIFLLLTILFDIIIILIFYIYDKNNSKKINEITKMISKINNRQFDIDINDFKEGELSILKNEISKTTTMLRQVADNSIKDKINLKDSLGDISHQLKTPLTSITIMIDNILDNPDMDEKTRKKFLINIKREIININFLVMSLLKLSKFDANVVKFNKEEVYIKDIIKESIKNVSMIKELKNISIKVSGDNNIKLLCDYKWQVESITNILKNSIEHTDEYGIVEINYSENKLYTRILIKDNGKGIDSEDLSHIFDRFYKGKKCSEDSIGIGLSLSKTIIEKEGGSITAKSTPNVGTIFTIKYLK
ncbi:MAG: HAMP domain-containing histidine kinase [Tenericutes bacterium]|nr:HAMP domain-containing histidine kinase [Mycoplasmatota bacterium]